MDKTENTREARLKYAFGSHQKVNEFHVTSDDQMFINPGDASNHASTLEDTSVEVAKRSDYLKSEKKVESLVDQQKAERKELFAKHKELFGKNPASTANIDDVKKKINDELVRLEEVKSKEESLANSNTAKVPGAQEEE